MTDDPPTYDDIVRELEKFAKFPPPRTEPIKLTAVQWDYLKLAFPPPPPDRFGGLIGGNLDYLTGVPVVLVEDEADSTPVVEGWWR